MATDRPGPHPVFSVTWLFWYVVLGYYFFAMDTTQEALAALAVFAYFFVPELAALKLNWRWTLSGTLTWVVRKLSKHTRPLVGWNLILVPAAAIPALVILKASWYLGGWWGVVLGGLIAGPFAVSQHQHWLRPDVHG